MAARVNSIMILGQRRERHGGDAFLLQRSRFFEARLAIDAPRLGLPVMHLAGLLGEGRADMLGIGLKMGAEILEEGIGLLAPGRLKRLGRFGRPSPHGRGHGRLLHLGAAATGTDHGAGAGLLVVGVARSEPGVEVMAPIADEREADHEASLRATCGERPAISTSNSRPCLSAGMRARASAEAARSISAKIPPGSSPASARISPHGETIRLWP